MTDAPQIPAPHQDSMPADEYRMDPAPDDMPRHPGVDQLAGKVAIASSDGSYFTHQTLYPNGGMIVGA